jgi:hypothetical protein
MNGGAKDHGYDAAMLGCQGIGGHATEAIATAPKILVLLVLVLTRLPGMIMTIVTVRSRLLGRDQMEPSMGVAAGERKGEQRHETSGEEWPHGTGWRPLIAYASTDYHESSG